VAHHTHTQIHTHNHLLRLLKVAAAAQAARKSRFNRAGLSQEPAQQQQQQQQQQPSTQQHQHPHHQQSNPQQPTREAPEGRDAEAGATQYDKPGLLYGTPPETASTVPAAPSAARFSLGYAWQGVSAVSSMVPGRWQRGGGGPHTVGEALRHLSCVWFRVSESFVSVAMMRSIRYNAVI